MTKSQEARALAAFGKRVAALRHERGLTQEELAEKSKLAARTIASIEQGRRWARLTTLHKLAKGLNMPTDNLLKDLNQSY
jgi:HTH-type transcriptional regulator, competence development regulator